MKKKIQGIILTVFISALVLLMNPITAFANFDLTDYDDVVGTGTPSITGSATLSPSIRDQITHWSGSNFYHMNGVDWICISANRTTPYGEGTIYSYTSSTAVYNATDSNTSYESHLNRLRGNKYITLAASLARFTISKKNNENYYMIGHSILSGIIGNDWTLYEEICAAEIRNQYGIIEGHGYQLVDSFIDAYISQGASGSSWIWVYIPNNTSTQLLLTPEKPSVPSGNGGVAIKKETSDGSAVDGYDIELWKGACGTGTKVGDYRTNASGVIAYYGSGTSVATSDIPIGTGFCFREKTDASGHALRNGQATEYRPATNDITTTANLNPTGSSILRITNTKNEGNKGYIQVKKTISASTGEPQEANGYSFVIYHMPCSQVTGSSPGDVVRTDSSGTANYGLSNGQGTLNIGDTYCVLEQTSTCANDPNDSGCAVRWINNAWSYTTFKPSVNPQQIQVNSAVNNVSFLNSDFPTPHNDKFCWILGKYMEDYSNGQSKWIPLAGVAFRMSHYELHFGYEDRPSCEIGTLYTSANGLLKWNWESLQYCTPSHTTRDIKDYTITESPGHSAGWYRYINGQTGEQTPYVYTVNGVGPSGPSIDEGGYRGGWLEASLRVADHNNDGLGWDLQTNTGNVMPVDVDGKTCKHEDTTAINTKVYFCLRVKKEDENGDKIEPDAFNDMKFSATNGSRTITTDDTTLSSINHETGVVSFFTGDSNETGVTEGDWWIDESNPVCGTNRGRELCNSPIKRLIANDWTVTEIAAPTGYTVNTDKVLHVKPIQMKAYQYDNSKPSAYERAKEDCLSGGTSDGETFSPYVYSSDAGFYVDADHYTKINDLTINNPDQNIRDQYIIKNKKLVLQWFKRATNDADTTPNDEAQLNGAKFVARRADGGVDGKAYAKIKDSNSDGQITLADRQTTKDSNGVEKLCYVTDGYQATAPTTYMESGDVNVNQDGSMVGEVCLANVNASKTNLNYIITEVDSADSHTFGSSKDKTVSATKFFVPRTDSNTIPNYSTEFEFEKKATETDSYTNAELANLSFSIFRQDNSGNATGDAITVKVAGTKSDGSIVYDYLRGDNPTSILHVSATNLKFVIKHLPKGKYVVKEIQGVTCEDNTDPSTCVGYYMPASNDQRFTITNCSSSVATACGSGHYGKETAVITNKPTEIKFTKSDFYHEYDAADVAEEGNNVPAEFADDKERSDFDRIVFTLYDKDGNPVKLKFVGNHGDCSSDSDYAEYRYVPGGTEGSTELHTCGGHIRITHLCRGRTYTIREESVPENSVFVREATDTTPIEKEYKIACSENDSPSSRSETHLIVDKPTRVTFEKRDAKYNYLIPDETTTFEVYQCPKGKTCHPGNYTSVEAREAAGMQLIKFNSRNTINNDEEDAGVEVYKYMSYSDAKNKSECTNGNRNNCYETKVHPYLGKLVFRYLPSGYNYVLLETVAPKNYLLPEGIKAETAFTVRNDTVDVDYIDVPNQPTGIIIRKYDNEGVLLGGAKFKVSKVTNYNPNKKPQDQEMEELKFKTIKQGVYEYRPVLDTNLVITCEGKECSNTNSFSYDKNWSNFDELLTSSGEKVKDVLKEGTAIIQYLEYDNYYVIEEVEAPKGHSLPSKEDDRFTIVHIGANTTVIEDTEMEFVNYPTPYTFYKFDEYNNLLDGAKFKLQKLNENKSYVTVKVSKVEGEESLYKAFEGENEIIETTNGKATVYYLEEGQYRIVEVEAAEGKELPKKTINVATFFVDKDGKVYGENIITNKKPTEKTYIKPEAKANLIITIQTGQTVVKYGLIIAVLIAGITGLMILLRKRK